MSWLEKLLPPKIQPTDPNERRTIPEGLWIKCPSCETVLYKNDLEQNLNVCPKCGHHHRIGARARLDAFLDGEGRYEIGAEVRATGTVATPPPWLRDDLRLRGIGRVLRAPRIALTGARRGGIGGRIDSIRSRAESALGRCMPAEQAALARGFVLGEDDRIPPETRTAFQRSGLAHHLAVSGENVVLLAVPGALVEQVR